MTTIAQKFDDLEDALARISYDLQEIDPDSLNDDFEKRLLTRSLVIAEAYRDALCGVSTWNDANRTYVHQTSDPNDN